MPHGTAHRLRGHAQDSVLLCVQLSDLSIGPGFSIGDGAENFPDVLLKGRSRRSKVRQKCRRSSGKVEMKPSSGIFKYRQVAFFLRPW